MYNINQDQSQARRRRTCQARASIEAAGVQSHRARPDARRQAGGFASLCFALLGLPACLPFGRMAGTTQCRDCPRLGWRKYLAAGVSLLSMKQKRLDSSLPAQKYV
ncbi:hypothetical protein LY76DRAFT_76729 [Colletotrichum caudatum]|nr:hypothetical protein LY76DRAFT_76729 [Colletotrichum caudatum]